MKSPRRFDPSEHATAPNPIIELSDAAARGWCWTLAQEPDGRWTLSQRDWLTSTLSGPIHTSDRPLADYREAMAWAEGCGVNLAQWTGNPDKTVWTDAAFRWIQMIVSRAARPYAAAS